jgi:hypothetical protein
VVFSVASFDDMGSKVKVALSMEIHLEGSGGSGSKVEHDTNVTLEKGAGAWKITRIYPSLSVLLSKLR